MILLGMVLGGGIILFVNNITTDGNELSEKNEYNVWNPHSDSQSFNVTLNDMILSASEGDYIVKMTPTLKFVDKDGFYKFKGYENRSDGDKKMKSDTKEEKLSNMELIINDTISDLMMRAYESQLLEKEVLKKYLTEGINKRITDAENPIIEEIYLENYVIQ